MEATTENIDPKQPHAYARFYEGVLRTCKLCGNGANAKIHRNLPTNEVAR